MSEDNIVQKEHERQLKIKKTFDKPHSDEDKTEIEEEVKEETRHESYPKYGAQD